MDNSKNSRQGRCILLATITACPHLVNHKIAIVKLIRFGTWIMFDLTNELQTLVQMYRTRADQSRGAVLAFASAKKGAGVSTCAQGFARLLAPNLVRGVWLFDLDFYINGQAANFSSTQAQHVYGQFGPPLDPTLQQKPFWRVSPQLVRNDGREVSSAWHLAMHQIGQHRLFVSKFRNQSLETGQSVHIIRAPSYWQRVRDAIDLAIIDVPSRDRSRTLLAIAPDVDGVVLVAEHGTNPNELKLLQHEVEAAGGNCLGVIFNASGELPQNSQQQSYQ
ncbi:MAG: hypothetical protein JKY46_09410 [Robiginitomaculum sp.]|nr:hypothetical protein [Robiginitomaculum sp.]